MISFRENHRKRPWELRVNLGGVNEGGRAQPYSQGYEPAQLTRLLAV